MARNKATNRELELLIQTFGIPVPGTVINYGDISNCIGHSKGTYRWNSIVSAWKKWLKKLHNIYTKAIMNIGIECLDSHKRIAYAGSYHVKGLRNLYESHDCAARTPRTGLNRQEKKHLDHYITVNAKMIAWSQTAAKDIKFPNPHVKTVLNLQPTY